MGVLVTLKSKVSKTSVHLLTVDQNLGKGKTVNLIKSRRFAAIFGMILVVVLVVAVLGIISPWSVAPSQGEQLYQQAKDLESQSNFDEAGQLYQQAFPVLQAENNPLTQQCRESVERMMIFHWTYPYNVTQLKIYLTDYFGSRVSADQINGWIERGDIAHYKWDGIEHFDVNAGPNLEFSHLDLMSTSADMLNQHSQAVLAISQRFVNDQVINSSQPFQDPFVFHLTQTVNVPRLALPNTGLLQIWFPLPINDVAQTNVLVESVTPDTYVKQSPSIDQDIGLLYMEVPLEQLRGNLSIEIKYSFSHYEQRFTIDSANVGTYDKNSDLYQQYTKSGGNIQITPEIQALAQKIVGNEANPYLAARKIYDYIVNNVSYHLMPHMVMWPRTSQTETKYVDEHQQGDCGAQSMYFSALCRSVGIPARATGGWQLWGGQPASHFWAEFYLPNYGWVPVDTSLAQYGIYPLQGVTDQQRQAYVDFFFGNMDPLRCTLQKDVDESLIPPANGMVLLPMAIQNPAALCPTLAGIPGSVITQYWVNNCTSIET